MTQLAKYQKKNNNFFNFPTLSKGKKNKLKKIRETKYTGTEMFFTKFILLHIIIIINKYIYIYIYLNMLKLFYTLRSNYILNVKLILCV